MRTILIAKDRKSGEDVILSGSEVEFSNKLAAYKEFNDGTSDEFSHVALVELVDIKKPLNLSQKIKKPKK